MKKNLLYTIIAFLSFVLSSFADGNHPNETPKVQTINAQDSIVFDCSQLTGATGNIQIPVSIISDDTVYSVDFSLKYDHSALQYDTTVNVTTYLQALSYYNTGDSTIRFTSSTFTPVKHDTTLALVKFILLSPSFNTGNLYTFKGYLNGTVCSIKYIPPSPLGLYNINEEMNVNVYPNPSSTKANISFLNTDKLEVLNMIGEPLLLENVKGQTNYSLNTDNLVNGVYLIRFTSSYGSIVKKLTVSH
ncbi:MAG: T9SS type A sorting domain-containing protein [Bacteroidota bacterium]